MPIVEVDVVLGPGETLEENAAKDLAEAIAPVLGSRPQGTWVRLDATERRCYAENGEAEPLLCPVFVRVTKKELGGDEDLGKEAASLAAAVAFVLHRQRENVHIIYEPPAAGRVAFGGRMVR